MSHPLEKPAPPISEFIKSVDYLGLPARNPPINPYPLQYQVLNEFYSENRNPAYRELVLAWGRRTGKDFISAIIAAYEAHRLAAEDRTEFPCTSFPVILIVATTTSQARISINELGHMLSGTNIRYSLANDTITMVINNKAIEVKIASAQSKSFIGKNVYSVILNECASYKDGAAANLWAAFAPLVHVNHGRMIAVSSPRAVNSFFHLLVTTPADYRLVSQAATWVVNHRHSKEALLRSHRGTAEEFRREFGGEFLEMDDALMEQVTLRLSSIQVEKLKRIARKRAYEMDTDVLYTDIIREMVEERL